MVDHLAADTEQGLGVGQAFMFLFQLLQFIFAQAKVVQLFELIAEQLVTGALLVTGVGQAFQLPAGSTPALGSQLYLTGQVDGARVLVHKATMGVGFQQRLVFVLAMNIDEQFA